MREWTLEQVEEEGAKLAAFNAAVQAALADRIEANPEASIARAKEVNARRKEKCHPGSQFFIAVWETILATRSAKEIADFLRSTDETEENNEQLRRMVPLGGLPEEQLREIRSRIYASE